MTSQIQPLATYRKIPQVVLATQNPHGTTEIVLDSDGNGYPVPATWWLIDEGAGRVSLMSDEAFRPFFEEYKVPCPLDSFINTVGNLNGNYTQAMGRVQDLESRVASLEAGIRLLAAAVNR